ncbi:MAG: polysaccharide pyruvyl transferase family protein [bacterium]
MITEENRNSYRYRLVSLLPCLGKPRYLMGGIQLPKKRINRILFTYMLKRTKHIFARDYATVHQLKEYGYDNVEFFMDTSYFAYNRKKKYEETEKKYIIINLNKNAEQFLPEIIQEVKKNYHQ